MWYSGVKPYLNAEGKRWLNTTQFWLETVSSEAPVSRRLGTGAPAAALTVWTRSMRCAETDGDQKTAWLVQGCNRIGPQNATMAPTSSARTR